MDLRTYWEKGPNNSNSYSLSLSSKALLRQVQSDHSSVNFPSLHSSFFVIWTMLVSKRLPREFTRRRTHPGRSMLRRTNVPDFIRTWKRFPATAPLVWKTNDPNRPFRYTTQGYADRTGPILWKHQKPPGDWKVLRASLSSFDKETVRTVAHLPQGNLAGIYCCVEACLSYFRLVDRLLDDL